MAEETERRRAGRPRDRATHDAILAAAEEILVEHGYAAFSIEAVAARAGVGKTSIYRRWSTKGALLVDVYMAGLGEDRPPAGEDARAQVRAMLLQSVSRLRRSGWATIMRSLVAEAQADAEISALVRDRVIAPRRALGRAILEEAIARGELAPATNPDCALDAMFGALWYRLLLGHLPVDEAFATAIVDQTFDGILAGADGRVPASAATVRARRPRKTGRP